MSRSPISRSRDPVEPKRPLNSCRRINRGLEMQRLFAQMGFALGERSPAEATTRTLGSRPKSGQLSRP